AGQAVRACRASARRQGEEAWVYANRRLLTQTGGAGGEALPAPAGAAAAVATVMRGGESAPAEVGGRLRVVVSIGNNKAIPDGAVLLSRSTAELHNRLHALWAWLSAVAAIGLLAAAIAAVMLARWVGRPLSALD